MFRNRNENIKLTKIVDSNEVANTPYNYVLSDSRKKKENEPDEKKTQSELCFFVFGCAGNATEQQKKVADLMNAMAAKEPPSFVIVLGDNFYDGGVDDPYSSVFETHFKTIYANDTLTSINKIPFFVIPGNHDHDVHKHSVDHIRNIKNHISDKLSTIFKPMQHFIPNITSYLPDGPRVLQEQERIIFDLQKIQAQIAHTYLFEENISLYRQPKLNLAVLPKWNMPGRFGVIKPEDTNIEIYLMDSTTYAKDFIDSLQDKNNVLNQANWLASSIRANQDTVKILCMHHPLHDAVSKRIQDVDDIKLYVGSGDLKKLSELGITDSVYSRLLDKILCFQHIKYHIVFSAHNHFNSFSRHPRGFFQIVAGGGGGHLEPRRCFENQEETPFFLKQHGAVKVSIHEKNQVTFDFYAIDGQHVKFSNQGKLPIQITPLDHKVELLRLIIVSACEKYLEHHIIPDNKSYQHGTFGKERTDLLKNFFNQYQPPDFQEAVIFLRKTLQEGKNEFSLINYVRREAQLLQETYETLLQPEQSKLNKTMADISPLFEPTSPDEEKSTAQEVPILILPKPVYSAAYSPPKIVDYRFFSPTTTVNRNLSLPSLSLLNHTAPSLQSMKPE